MADHNDDQRLISGRRNKKCTIRGILIVSVLFFIFTGVWLCGPILMLVGYVLDNKPIFIEGIAVFVSVIVLSAIMKAVLHEDGKKKKQPQHIDRLETGTSPHQQPSAHPEWPAAPSPVSLPSPYDGVSAPPPSDEAISSVYAPYPAPLQVPSSAYASYPAPTERSSAANPPYPNPKVV